jgi:hypothetical protein
MAASPRDDNGAALINVVGTIVAPYASNPSTTGVGTDTQFKWGTNGTTTVNHVFIQNNLASATVYYAFDTNTTASGAAVYALAPGQFVAWDRQCTILHLQTAASQNFGGTTGITVEGGL